MGIFNFFWKLGQNNVSQDGQRSSTQQKLSYADKESILAKQVTTRDMVQFSGLPYHLNCPVRLFNEPHGHAHAYIDLTGQNISAAIVELEQMNARIRTDSCVSSKIPSGLQIPVGEIVFTPSKEHGYTKLLCTPYTFDGKVAEVPLSLVFMTDLDGEKDTTHGTLYYAPDGRVQKADIYFWRRHKGFFFYYDTLDRSFVLSKVEMSNNSRGYRPPEVVYQDPYWAAQELARKKENSDFRWLQTNLPDKCPKSVSGFRRMKHNNSKNFQALVSEAARRGRDIR